MAFFLNFFGSFKKSAQELKSVRCIAAVSYTHLTLPTTERV